MGKNQILDSALFTYVISPNYIEGFSHHKKMSDGQLTVSYTANTDVVIDKAGTREVVIIGYCIDAHGEIARADIPTFFLSQEYKDMTEAYRLCDRFAGKFVFLYRDGQKMAAWGDATCSIQVNYHISGKDIYLASTDKLLADVLGYKVSNYSEKIRKGSSVYSQPLPNDLTMYDEIKTLLPNHYLSCTACQPVRVKLDTHEISSPGEVSAIIDKTAVLAKTIASAYQEDYDFVFPLTAGTDSRTVLSFFKGSVSPLQCYTFKHPGFAESAAELNIPQKICKAYRYPYVTVEDLKAPDDYIQAAMQVLGAYCDPTGLNLSYTFRSRFGGKVQADGAIIDEVGKSTQENAVPNFLMNVPFFMCKLHNYESLTKQEVRKYISGISAAGEKKHIADLFAMEQKCGRRVGQVVTLYSSCGIGLLSIFNCRELILQWTRIPRKIRATKLIPHEYIKRNDPPLMDFPFNPDDKLVALMEKSWITFYLATFAKYFLQRLKK